MSGGSRLPVSRGSRLPGAEAFTLSPRRILLNHGSFGAVPRAVQRAQDRERAAMEADPLGFMAALPARLRAAASAVGRRLGVPGRDLVFVDNATTGVATVLASWPWRRGDRIVTTTHAYGAVREALHRVARRHGAVVDEVAVPFPIDGPQAVLDAVVPRLAGARFAVLDAITSPTGLVLPIAPLVAACRAHGVPVLVDAAHVPGQVAVDVGALGADWWTGNLHKWAFAPKGTAVLVARRDRQAVTEPLVASHDVRRGWPHAFDWTGTRDPTGWLAAPAALDWLDGIGADAVRARNDAQCAEAADVLSRAWRVPIPSPPSMRAAMATLPVPGGLPGSRAPALHDALRHAGIEVPCVPFAGHTWVRISAQLYTSMDDVHALARAMPAAVASVRGRG